MINKELFCNKEYIFSAIGIGLVETIDFDQFWKVFGWIFGYNEGIKVEKSVEFFYTFVKKKNKE